MRESPFADRPVYDITAPWRAVDSWPARWILPGRDLTPPWVAMFRCVFEWDGSIQDQLHVTADERYELYLDGRHLGGGSERGDRGHWYFESHTLDLAPGKHVLSAKVWALGKFCPWAQMTVSPGFLCCPENPLLVEKLATGKAVWEMKHLPEYRFTTGNEEIGVDMGGGAYEKVDFRLHAGNGKEAWEPVRTGKGGNDGFHLYTLKAVPWLRPAPLPLHSEKKWRQFAGFRAGGEEGNEIAWKKLIEAGESFLVPPLSRQSLWLDLGDYVCAYPELRWKDGEGSRISFAWAESLRDAGKEKNRRLEEAVEFVAPRDEIIAGPAEKYFWRSLWWRCGRFVEVVVETQNVPLLLESLEFRETRYPLESEATWQVTGKDWRELLQICVRSAQMCAHETYMDCPYYEQLMYAGDTRIQCLMTHVLTKDDRLVRKAVRLFDYSRLNPSGWTTDAYPSDGGKIIPPFSLWWIGMVHDLALWRRAEDLVKETLPGIRAILDLCWGLVDKEGLLRMPRGWNFVDSNFPGGVPPGGEPGGINAPVQLQYILALGEAAELEDYAGEAELGILFRRRREAAVLSFERCFRDEASGLFFDEPVGKTFSEQTQILAFLAGRVPGKKGLGFLQNLEGRENVTRASAYFSHYLFEACFRAGEDRIFFEGMKPWFQCLEEGYKTTPENFGPTRSECHAWSAHPLYHYFTGVLGIRPTDFAFSRVEIRPRPERMGDCGGNMPHPEGEIRLQLRRAEEGWEAEIDLPGKLEGRIFFEGKSADLKPGRQVIFFHKL